MTAPTTTSPSDPRALAEFRRAYGTLGDQERRTVPLSGSVKNTGHADGRLKIVGHASVFNSPSVEMRSPVGTFTEYIAPHAFDNVLRTNPDVLLTWDHDTLRPLARTTAGTLELSVNSRGLRYFATVTPTSYAEDLRSLMNDGVVNQSSFLFRVASGGEEWTTEGDRVIRTITDVGELFDVCVCAAGAYPATDSAIARSFLLDYAVRNRFLARDPRVALFAARVMTDVSLRRRRVC